MNRDWQLRMFKYLVNVPFRLLDRVLKFPEPRYTQTRMLQHTYRVMLEVYKIDVKKGVFDVPDGNFERFLSVSSKMIAQIAERDRYYRKWVGLTYLIAEAEMKRLQLTPEQIIKETWDQWREDLTFLPRDSLRHQDFLEHLLAQDLYNLVPVASRKPS